jgi:hypothetical protein
MPLHEYSVQFRIIDETLDPSAVTNELGLQPSLVWTAGSYKAPGKTYPGMWAYNGSAPDVLVSWNSLAEGLEFLLGKLLPHREAIQRYGKNGAKLIWWCANFQSGFDGGPLFSPELLKKLGEFGAELFIDNYFSPPNEDREQNK